MTHPGWIIVFFAAAALIALAIGAARVLSALRRLRDHAGVTASAPIFADASMISQRAQRFGALQERIEALQARMDAAKRQLATAVSNLKMRPGRIAVDDARDDLRELIEELR